jgi:hypothetical protein
MSFTEYKYTEETKVQSDKSKDCMMESINIDEKDIKMLKLYSENQEDISIPSLIDLVLLNLKDKSVKSENYDELKMFKMITVDGSITTSGKTYLESADAKERLKTILND